MGKGEYKAKYVPVRDAVLEEDRFTCQACGGEISWELIQESKENAGVHHIHPTAAGGDPFDKNNMTKLDALEEIIEEANGQPILCSYAYRSDAERIMKRFHALDPINLTECKSEHSLNEAMRRWRQGDCRLMIAHPLSAGHGIDSLQHRGHIIVWYGLNWSLDSYSQMNARLHRQGQSEPVICHRILCKDTMDEAQALALDEKATTQASLRKAVKDYREKRESK